MEKLELDNNILSIIDVINNIKNKSIISYLQNIFGTFILNTCTDETEELYLLNTKILLENLDSQNEYFTIIQNSPNIIIDKLKNDIIIQNYNNKYDLKINKLQTIKKYNWNNIIVNYICPGVNIFIFYHNSKWKICSDNSLNINKIINDKNTDTLEILFGKFKNIIDLDILNKNYYYHLIYQNNKSNDYVDNILINNSYDNFILIDCFELYSHNIIIYQIPKINKIKSLKFIDLDNLLFNLNSMEYENKLNKKLTYTGYILKIVKNNKYIIYIFFYNEIYNIIKKNVMIKNNNIKNNINRIYLDLYLKNNLHNILPYISNYSSEIIHRINASMKTLSKEILNIYHLTRKKNKKELYLMLSETYKQILYNLHGLYINNKKKEIKNKTIEYNEGNSITVYDVYYNIKKLSTVQIINLYEDRENLLKNLNFKNILYNDCIYTITQSKLILDY